MYIAVNKIPANPHMIAAFKQAAPDMKQFSGFLGLEIWEAADGSLQAVSRWTSKEALDEYTKNSAFRRHHSAGAASGEQKPASDAVSYYTAEVIV
jgi:heme-degrading monooxygenase HmoA